MREALLAVVENVKKEPVRPEEVERARTSLLNDFEKTQLDTGAFVRALSEFGAIGDWRLFFLYRERLKQVALADVQRVAEHYLKPANRVLGVFVPTDKPERADPAVAGMACRPRRVQGRPGGRAPGRGLRSVTQEYRVAPPRPSCPTGIRTALLQKKTRGGRVVANLTLHWGDEKSLTGRDAACTFAGGMLMRGTRQKSRAELKDAFEKLNASVSISGDGASIEVRRENLAPALRLVAECCASRVPGHRVRGDEARRDQRRRVAAHGSLGARLRTLSAPPASIRKATLTTADRSSASRGCARRRWRRGRLLPRALRRERRRLRRGGRVRRRRAHAADRRAVRRVEDAAAIRSRAEPLFRAARRRQRGHHPRQVRTRCCAQPEPQAARRSSLFSALVLANYLLGGSSTSRLPGRVREKEGLSYSTFTSFNASAFDERGLSHRRPSSRRRTATVCSAPSARAGPRRARGLQRSGIEAGKQSVLEARRMARPGPPLAGRLSSYLFMKRTLDWDVDFENRISRLTAAEVNAAVKQHFNPARLSIVSAGDFKQK